MIIYRPPRCFTRGEPRNSAFSLHLTPPVALWLFRRSDKSDSSPFPDSEMPGDDCTPGNARRLHGGYRDNVACSGYPRLAVVSTQQLYNIVAVSRPLVRRSSSCPPCRFAHIRRARRMRVCTRCARHVCAAVRGIGLYVHGRSRFEHDCVRRREEGGGRKEGQLNCRITISTTSERKNL